MSTIYPNYKTYHFLEKKYQLYLIQWMKKMNVQNKSMIASIDNDLIIQHIDDLQWNYKILSLYLPPKYMLANPDKPWNWDKMSINPQLTWDDYIQNKDKNWNVEKLTMNQNIDIYKLIQSGNISWKTLSIRNNIPLDILEKYIHVTDMWSWMCLSINRSIPISFILKYPTAPWDWKQITCRATPDEIIYYKSIPWNYTYLSMHYNEQQFPFRYIYENPDRPWNYTLLSKRSDIDIQMVIEYPDRGWNWSFLTQYVHFDTIKKYPDLNWQHDVLHSNVTLTKEHVQSNPQYNWDMKKLLRLKTPLNVEDVIQNPSHLNWEYLLCDWNSNPNIMELVQAFPDKNWYWMRISQSPYITLQFIEQYKDKSWDWKCISKRKFKKSKDIWINEYRLLHITAMRLQRMIRHHFWNPNYKVGRRVISRS